MTNKFEEILKQGLEAIIDNNGLSNGMDLQIAKITLKRLENEIIRVAALSTVDAAGNIPPTTKEELLKL